MQNKIYQNNTSDLLEYLTDTNNEFTATSTQSLIFTQTEINRYNIPTRELRLLKLTSDPVTYKISVLYQPSEIQLRLVINSFSVMVNYEFPRTHINGINRDNIHFISPQAEYFIPISSIVPQYPVDYVQVEQFIDNYVTRHIEAFINSIFNGEVAAIDTFYFHRKTDSELNINIKKIIK